MGAKDFIKNNRTNTEDDDELQQPLDRSFNWDCFTPHSPQKKNPESANEKAAREQAQKDFEQHYDLDGVTIWNGNIITTSTPLSVIEDPKRSVKK